MNELVVLIVDDETKVAEVLKHRLQNSIQLQHKLVFYTAKSVAEAVKMIEQYTPDLVFLDIQMPKENGLALFDYFEKPLSFEVVITTAYSQYALEVLNQHPCLYYLLKPIAVDNLQLAYDKYLEKEGEQLFIKLIKSNQKRDVVSVDDIIYCKADDNYCEVYLKDQKYLVSKTLGAVSAKLQHPHFYRVGRSYVVNMKHIKHIETGSNRIVFKHEIVINDCEVKHDIVVSAAKMKEFRAFEL
ncbi:MULTISPECIES: LytTR family DNA-binding domain-containing protein [unclassified Myroides]|uniref:LytR/AlgR family response regulator transcription factor n=1 Tax=unclassified Myroides TaxID=2642485 RepID=UPI0015FA8C55|nr:MULTISPECIES: LytTR family DNA-binding domain-containing protein [unclassified Myroides]MBB1150841.1 response regulator transcription factor [Myroides sp. NP-2]MDM1407794.1 response regulator transcription factor [Myroides sp. DF42-4-2]